MAARGRDVRFTIRGVDQISRTVRAVNQRVGGMVRPIRSVRRAVARLGQTRGFQRLRGAVARVGRVLRNFAIAGVAGVAAATLAMRRFVQTGDQVAKTADNVGLAVGAFQELRFAADRGGVSADTFAQSMRAFSRRLGDLRAGQGTLFSTLRRTNPELLRQLRAAESNEEAFAHLNRAVADLEDPAARAALVSAAFSRAGLDLVNVLGQAPDELAALRQEARDLGLVMDERTARAAERVQDQFTNLRAVVQGIAFQIGGELLPVVEEIVGGMLAWVRENRDWLRQGVARVARDVAAGLRFTRDVVVDAIPYVKAFVDQMGGLRNIALIVGGVLLGTVVAAIAGVIAIVGPMAIAIAAAVAGLTAAAGQILAHWEPIKAFFSDLAEFIREKVQPAIDLGRRTASALGLGDAEANARGAGGPTAPLTGLAAASGIGPQAGRVDGRIDVRVDVAGEGRGRVTRLDAGASDLDLAADVGPAGVL